MSLISNLLYKQISKAGKTEQKGTKMAVVTSISGSDVFIQFYGESAPSQKPYKRLDSYTPTVNDVVMLQNINNSYVITGKVV